MDRWHCYLLLKSEYNKSFFEGQIVGGVVGVARLSNVRPLTST